MQNPGSKEKKQKILLTLKSNIFAIYAAYPEPYRYKTGFRAYPLDFNRITKESSLGVFTAITLLPFKLFSAYIEKKTNYVHHTTINAETEKAIARTLLYDGRFLRHACLYAPIYEEVIMRGILMPAIRQGLRKMNVSEKYQSIGSVIGSSLVFSALHLPGNRFSSFIGGLSYAALTTLCGGSLWAGTAGHIANNTMAVMISRGKLRK